MVDKINSENVKKKDLELILEDNKNTIEIQTEVADQFEDIVGALSDFKKEQADFKKEQTDQTKKLDKLIEQAETTNKDLFKIQILFVTGLLSIVVQIIQVFVKK